MWNLPVKFTVFFETQVVCICSRRDRKLAVRAPWPWPLTVSLRTIRASRDLQLKVRRSTCTATVTVLICFPLPVRGAVIRAAPPRTGNPRGAINYFGTRPRAGYRSSVGTADVFLFSRRRCRRRRRSAVKRSGEGEERVGAGKTELRKTALSAREKRNP